MNIRVGGISRTCQRPGMGRACSNESMWVTLAETPSSGCPSPVARQDSSGGIRTSTLPQKPLTQNLSCLQEVQGQRWSRD